MNGPITIGIDHGYAAMKTTHFSFPTGLVAYEHEPYTQKDVLEYGGKFYVVGSGRQPLQKDKTQSEDYYLLTLAAIAKELVFRKEEPAAEIHLAAGLPLTSFGRDKKKFREYLLRGGQPVSFRYEGVDYIITIREVSLFPQGYAAVLTQSGLRHIDYKNGVTRQIDTAVRNAVLTASAQLSGEIMQANIEESGVAYVQVSAHWGARDSHAVWQGKVYSLAEFRSVCGYGEPSNPDHIYSYNCRHTHYPYWPGISEPVEYPPEPGPFEADGKTYTYYQATQRQRAMERSIRAMKRDALAQDAMGDKGALAAAKIRLDEKTAAYKRFSAQVNMRPRLERTQVFGYDRGAAARASKEVRFQEFWKAISISQPKRAHAAERADYVQQVFQNAAKLSEADAKILETIAERFSWTEVPTEAADIYTLAALTARTGDEFAMFARGNVKIIMHGASANGIPWTLPEDLARRVFDEQLRWTGHSHPTTMNLRASDDDRKTLAVFKWQKKSTIVDLTGKTIPFTTNKFDDVYK